ncbi:MAG: hypothetical protein Q9221_003841 [Calogaya cf. arnoldii]
MPPKRTRTDSTGPQKKQKTGVLDNSDVEEHNQTAVVELEGTTLVHDGDGFQSQIFTILAGSQRQKFTAHASFLSQSPVLDPGHTINALFDLAELYGVAEKYQLQGLKNLIIKKLESIVDVAQRPIEFIAAAKEICNCIPDSDRDFRDFFRQGSAKMVLPPVMPKVLRRQFYGHLAEGGTMAIDMVVALCAKYEAQISKMKLTAKTSHNKIIQLTAETGELSRDKQRYKEHYERLTKSSNNTT